MKEVFLFLSMFKLKIFITSNLYLERLSSPPHLVRLLSREQTGTRFTSFDRRSKIIAKVAVLSFSPRDFVSGRPAEWEALRTEFRAMEDLKFNKERLVKNLSFKSDTSFGVFRGCRLGTDETGQSKLLECLVLSDRDPNLSSSNFWFTEVTKKKIEKVFLKIFSYLRVPKVCGKRDSNYSISLHQAPPGFRRAALQTPDAAPGLSKKEGLR